MRILLVILFIPFLTAMSHDLYINYYLDEEKLQELKKFKPNIKDFRMSDLGWVWNEYSPDSLEVVKDSVKEPTWENAYLPVLKLPSIWVTFIPFLIALVISWIMKLARGEKIIDFQVRGAKKYNDNSTVYKHAKSNSMKFKRRN